MHAVLEESGVSLIAYSKENDFHYNSITENVPPDASCIISAKGNTPDKALSAYDFPFSVNDGKQIKRLSRYTLYGNINNAYIGNDGKWNIEFETVSWDIGLPIMRNTFREHISSGDYLSLFDFSPKYFIDKILNIFSGE